MTLDIAAAEVSACSVRRAAEKPRFCACWPASRSRAGENIALDGRIIATASTSVPPESGGVGLVFQDYALFPQMTVLDNVAFGLKGLHAPISMRPRAKRWGVGLTARAEAYPYMLSGGEQQRVALARAIDAASARPVDG